MVHLVMDVINVVFYAFLVLTVDNTNAWWRPYNINARFLRQAMRFSRRPAIWRVVPLGIEKKQMLQTQQSATKIDETYSIPEAVTSSKTEDQEPSPSEYGHNHGRVLMKVFRGPGDEHFAKHGFFVKHPEDD